MHTFLSRFAGSLAGTAKVIAGFVLLGLGGVLALPGIPGPGIVLALLGLLLLSSRFSWAGKALAWLRRRTEAVRSSLGEKVKAGH